VTVVLDDRLLRDWIANRDDTVVSAISAEQEATTNLCYARLCESAARADRGAILEGWAPMSGEQSSQAWSPQPTMSWSSPMRQLAWRCVS